MNASALLKEIQENLDTVINQDSPLGISLWKELLTIHPTDIALFLVDLNNEDAQHLLVKLPTELKWEVFRDLPDSNKAYTPTLFNETDKVDALNSLTAEELTDLFDHRYILLCVAHCASQTNSSSFPNDNCCELNHLMIQANDDSMCCQQR